MGKPVPQAPCGRVNRRTRLPQTAATDACPHVLEEIQEKKGGTKGSAMNSRTATAPTGVTPDHRRRHQPVRPHRCRRR